jgi:hypothetical protein
VGALFTDDDDDDDESDESDTFASRRLPRIYSLVPLH